MAALITAGGLGATGNVAASGTVSVIASGDFSGGAEVEITLVADSLRPARVALITSPQGLSVSAVTGQTLTATVIKGNSDASIDISAI